MITVLMRGEESLYRKGMQCLLEELFYQRWHQEVIFSGEFTEASIHQADIIILGLGPGDNVTCMPELLHRGRGIIIGLVDLPPVKRRIHPNCYQDMLFLARKAPIAEVQNIIAEHWMSHSLQPYQHGINHCHRCKHEMLSQQQSRVMAFLYNGMPVVSIASALKISDKTVFSHKYLVMQRFNLHSDYELHAFLGRLAKKNIPANYFREYLETKCRTETVVA